MRRWLFVIACGLAGLPLLGQEQVDPKPAPAATAPTPAIHPAAPVRDDGTIHDSLGYVSVRPVPDSAEMEPLFLARVAYLRDHHDDILACTYLRQIVTNGNIPSRYRARAILELADSLASQHQQAESLCWLKIWMEMYPSRPEMGAVAYRVGSMYAQMGLPDLARDAYYLALAHTINEGQVQTADDLQRYTELTVGTLWGLATNEYQSGQWARGAELFARYRQECPTASAISLEKAAYLQADCYYQLKQPEKAMSLYEETLAKHPFNPLAPEARLRLYHLYMMKHSPEQAREDLEALAWTVRTVWPKDETYWQRQTAELLLALNQHNISILPPLIEKSSLLPPEGKTWQEALNHYDALVSYETVTAKATMDSNVDSSDKADVRHGLAEDADLQSMDRYLNQVLPPPQTASNP